MKKQIVTLVVVLLAMALNAQVSVWDGTTEPWINGSGTAEDPYLIESAQNMAYLASQVNAPSAHNPLGYDIFEDTYFRLATDLDLGSTNGLSWTPIGKSDRIHTVTTWFDGHFDGAGHTVFNMKVEYPGNQSNLSFGLFGNARNGSIKDITVYSNCDISVIYENISGESGLHIGSVLGQGHNECLEGCVNRGAVYVDGGFSNFGARCGGLFGVVSSGTIINCHNTGDVYCREFDYYGGHTPAGIVGSAGNCTIFGCSNTGNITCAKYDYGLHTGGVASGGIVGSAGGNVIVEQCCNTGTLLTDELEAHNIPICSGGIVGCSSTGANYPLTLLIRNCYSVADISAITAMPEDKGNYAGGIFGGTYSPGWDENYTTDITIENCYTVGTIVADTIGGIIAKYGFMPEPELPERQAVALNSYYVNSIESVNDYGIAVSSEYMKSEEFVNALNTDGIVFLMDYENENNGYPILINRYQLSAEDINAAPNELLVYPNPASNYVRIESFDKLYFQLVELYSIDGRVVKSQTSDFETVDITNLNTGIYIMKVTMSDGREVVEKIIKE